MSICQGMSRPLSREAQSWAFTARHNRIQTDQQTDTHNHNLSQYITNSQCLAWFDLFDLFGTCRLDGVWTAQTPGIFKPDSHEAAGPAMQAEQRWGHCFRELTCEICEVQPWFVVVWIQERVTLPVILWQVLETSFQIRSKHFKSFQTDLGHTLSPSRSFEDIHKFMLAEYERLANCLAQRNWSELPWTGLRRWMHYEALLVVTVLYNAVASRSYMILLDSHLLVGTCSSKDAMQFCFWTHCVWEYHLEYLLGRSLWYTDFKSLPSEPENLSTSDPEFAYRPSPGAVGESLLTVVHLVAHKSTAEWQTVRHAQMGKQADRDSHWSWNHSRIQTYNEAHTHTHDYIRAFTYATIIVWIWWYNMQFVCAHPYKMMSLCPTTHTHTIL